MRVLLVVILFFSINSWAGSEIQRCSNDNRVASIRLCIEWTRSIGKLNIGGERLLLEFSEEVQPKAFFILSDGSSGLLEILKSDASLQINNDAPIQLTCSDVKPGSCAND